MTKSTTNMTRETKSDTVRRLLTRKTGADIAALQEATSWQSHSIRAAVSRLRKAGYAIERIPPKANGRAASYRITSAPADA